MKVKHRLLSVFFIGLLIGLSFILISASSITGASVADNNAVPLSNEQYAPRVASMIREADSVHIIMFRMSYYPEYANSSANDLLDSLIEAKENGADVKIIMEGGEEFLGEDFAYTQKLTCSYLQEGGVDVRFDPSGIDTHAKLVILDDAVILGSTNWNYYALEHNNEVGAVIKSSKVVDYFETYFDDLWSRSNPAVCKVDLTECSSVPLILGNKDFCDKKIVNVSGAADNIKFKTSSAGNDYATFDLVDGESKLRVYIGEQPSILAGDNVAVEGTFYKVKKIGKYTYYDEIDATIVESLFRKK